MQEHHGGLTRCEHGVFELRSWLEQRALISNAKALDSTLASLSEQHIFDLRDLCAYAGVFPLEECLPRLTAARIREALALASELPSPPPSPPTGAERLQEERFARERLKEDSHRAASAGAESPQSPRNRPIYQANGGVRMDMKTAIHAMKLKFMQESIDDFRVPWYILDPTGEVIAKQRRMQRREHRHQQEMDRIRKADLDGDGRFSLDEIKQFAASEMDESQHHSRRRCAPWRARQRFKLLAVLSKLNYITLYPGWDLLTLLALVFTAAATPCERTAAHSL